MKTCHGLRARATSKIELQRGKRNALVTALDRVPSHIDREVTDLEVLWTCFVGSSNAGTNASDQFLGLERLNDVVVGAGLEARAPRRRCRSWP